ncbi:MAG: histidine phosphatase family protein [Candidatus Parcubacteria bacterium]|nr:MAG: histidine phosphatase family protein [Candidatus Parcubacteria bacterium]
MLNIYLARHGQDEDNFNGILNGHRNNPLTELGQTQAQTLAAHIKEQGLSFEKIYASPLRRAHQTAQIVAAALDYPEPTVEPDLIERDFGVMTGKKISEIETLHPDEIFHSNGVTYFLSAEGSETLPEALERAKGFLAKLRAAHPEGGNILLVTHGDFSKMMFAAFYDLPWKEALQSFHFGNSELILLAPGLNPDEAHIFKVEQFNK